MNNILSIFKREVKGYFATPLAYVFIIVFLLLCTAATFWKNGFFFSFMPVEQASLSLRPFFADMPGLLALIVPAIAMRLWAEERGSNSIELLFSLPITPTQAVLGKYFAALAVLLLSLALTFPVVITAALMGDPDNGTIVMGYIGSFLMAAMYLAIGSFSSMLSRSQVIAFVIGVGLCLLFYITGNPSVMNFLSGLFPQSLVEKGEMISVVSRFESMSRGVLDLRDCFFFLVMTAGWLFANIILLAERRAA